MKKLLFVFLTPILITCDVEGNDEEIYSTFLDVNNETMWQSTEEYNEYSYIGFSNNIEEVLFYRAYIYDPQDYKHCDKYKEGKNMISGSECNQEGETIQTYTIVTNSENQLVLDFNYYDDSCDSPFSIDYRYSYSIDGDYLYETIEQVGEESEFNEYSKSSFSFNDLCE
jgi:hypothetical protein